MNAIDVRSPAPAGPSPFHVFHPELRALAASMLAGEAPGHALQATDLISETWLRLEGKGRRQWNDRAHFLSAAAGVMRNILVDQARRGRSRKHGGGWVRASEAVLENIAVSRNEEVLAVDEALQRFTIVNPLKAELVRLHHFGGLSLRETAVALGISEPTAKRHWKYARKWLRCEITLD